MFSPLASLAVILPSSFFYPLVLCSFHFEEAASEWHTESAIENPVYLESGGWQKKDLILDEGRRGFCALARDEGNAASVWVKLVSAQASKDLAFDSTCDAGGSGATSKMESKRVLPRDFIFLDFNSEEGIVKRSAVYSASPREASVPDWGRKGCEFVRSRMPGSPLDPVLGEGGIF